MGDSATKTRSIYMYADIKHGLKGFVVINSLTQPTSIDDANAVMFHAMKHKRLSKAR